MLACTTRGAALSLRKSPTRTPAFREAIRRNAEKSTGPWTVRGKGQSCLNRLKTGARSKTSHAKSDCGSDFNRTIGLQISEPQRRDIAKKTKHLYLRAVERAK
jgi:hypothetical protein